MGVKESRHIAGLKDIYTPSETGEAMLGAEAEEGFCIVSLIFMISNKDFTPRECVPTQSTSLHRRVTKVEAEEEAEEKKEQPEKQ